MIKVMMMIIVYNDAYEVVMMLMVMTIVSLPLLEHKKGMVEIFYLT